MPRLGLFSIALILALLSGCARPAPGPAPESSVQQGTRIEPPTQLSDFTLPSSLGRDLSLSELRGKPLLLFFGYTFCPDVCPMTLSEMKRVKADLGADSEQLQVVFISVDGARDTPEVLARHLAAFDPTFIGLQGDDATLRRIGPEYGLYYKRNTPEGTSAAYLVDHSSATYLIDAEGRLRVVYSFGTPPEVIAADVRALLKEG
ncbi:MAG: SCO family protein [Oscillochloridaceae bacterium]|nr:SCO family protein [Chloroflexaceae bacterium]MDW8389884.1 SCO family protein [Oscillochloridaceae bacterium]